MSLSKISRDTLIFSVLVFLICLAEGLGFSVSRNFAFQISLITPYILFRKTLLSRSKNQVTFPVKLTVLFLLFLIFSSFATLFSVNMDRSFQQLLFIISVFLIFIYTYNKKKSLQIPIILIVFILSAIFSIYSLLLNQESLSFLVPTAGYNFVYAFYNRHNLLGDFLLIPLVFILNFLFEKKQLWLSLILILFFLPMFLISYSRSAYASFAITIFFLLFYAWKNRKSIEENKKNHFFILLGTTIVIVTLTLTFFIASIEKARYLPILAHINTFLINYTALPNKTFWATRDIYFNQAIQALKEKPLFGWGLNNFIYASKKYVAELDQISYSSHNILLDSFVEQGLIAGTFFLALILLLLCNSKTALQKNRCVPFTLAFLALFLNFQALYTFKMYSIFLLFFIFAGFMYEEKEKSHNIPAVYFSFASTIILIAVIIINTSYILSRQKQYHLAVLLYPLNYNAYKQLIDKELKTGNKETTYFFLNKYEKLFSGDAGVLEYIGDTYKTYGNKRKALEYYERAYMLEKFNNLELIKKYFTAKVEFL